MHLWTPKLILPKDVQEMALKGNDAYAQKHWVTQNFWQPFCDAIDKAMPRSAFLQSKKEREAYKAQHGWVPSPYELTWLTHVGHVQRHISADDRDHEGQTPYKKRKWDSEHDEEDLEWLSYNAHAELEITLWEEGLPKGGEDDTQWDEWSKDYRDGHSGRMLGIGFYVGRDKTDVWFILPSNPSTNYHPQLKIFDPLYRAGDHAWTYGVAGSRRMKGYSIKGIIPVGWGPIGSGSWNAKKPTKEINDFIRRFKLLVVPAIMDTQGYYLD